MGGKGDRAGCGEWRAPFGLTHEPISVMVDARAHETEHLSTIFAKFAVASKIFLFLVNANLTFHIVVVYLYGSAHETGQRPLVEDASSTSEAETGGVRTLSGAAEGSAKTRCGEGASV